MSFTLQELAKLVGGELVGDGSRVIVAARPLNEATADDISFVENPKQFAAWQASSAAAAIVPLTSAVVDRPVIRVAEPLVAFCQIVLHFRGRPAPLDVPAIDPTARIHPSVQLGEGCRVGPFAVIGEGAKLGQRCVIHAHVVIGSFCELADDVELFPHVVLYGETKLGQRVRIHAHAVIGADGFGYRTVGGVHQKVQHVGWVEIQDDVEIGAGSMIDRGTYGATRIGAGTKIDNMVQIAHNCQIGPKNLMAAQVGLAGSVSTGAYVVMGGQVGIADHVHIGDQALVGAQAGTASNLEGGKRYLGSPAMPIEITSRVMAIWPRLPELRRDIQRIKKHLGLNEAES